MTAALFVYMLLPSALLFLGALLTSLLLSNLALSYSCHQHVWAFLWGCVLLFYVWVFYHFFVLFGPRGWTNLTSKLALFALLAVALGLWLAFGHLTLRDHVDGECVRTHTHPRTRWQAIHGMGHERRRWTRRRCGRCRNRPADATVSSHAAPLLPSVRLLLSPSVWQCVSLSAHRRFGVHLQLLPVHHSHCDGQPRTEPLAQPTNRTTVRRCVNWCAVRVELI